MPYMDLEEQRGKKGRPVYCGTAKVTVLGRKEDGSLCSAVFDIPLRLESDRTLPKENVKAFVECRASSVRCRCDAEKLYVDFEVICASSVMAFEDAQCVQVIRMMPDKAREQEKGAVATLYFPEEGESVFDIAKKYRVSRLSLLERNGLEKEEDMAGRALLIPKKR